MSTIKSSLGLKYPTYRDAILKCSDSWLNGKREDDGAEGLWRIHDELYDLNDFIEVHPGGRQWIQVTKGTDITEAFETHHLKGIAEKLLPKYFERKAKSPRNYPWTFHENGFYRTLKRNVQSELKKIPESSVLKTKIMTDFLFLSFVLTASMAAIWNSFVFGTISGIFLSLLANAAHNFFHQKDNFRMYYFDLTTMHSRDWRISHAMSHHLYTNTVGDLEISMFEPFYNYLPGKKSKLKYLQWIIAPGIYALIFHVSFIKSLVYNLVYNNQFRWQNILPFSIFLMMTMLPGSSFEQSSWMYLWIMTTSSFFFTLVGVNAAHHHPNLFHDGDAPRPKLEMDFGLHQMDTVADKTEITGNLFLVLTNFGDHALHHLFPTIDHAKLDYLYPIFLKTCEEFGVEWKLYNQKEMTIGQFQQLVRKKNELPPKSPKILVKNET